MIQCPAIIGVMHMMVVDGRKAHEKHRAIAKRSRPFGTAENLLRAERMAFERSLPSQLAKLLKEFEQRNYGAEGFSRASPA